MKTDRERSHVLCQVCISWKRHADWLFQEHTHSFSQAKRRSADCSFLLLDHYDSCGPRLFVARLTDRLSAVELTGLARPSADTDVTCTTGPSYSWEWRTGRTVITGRGCRSPRAASQKMIQTTQGLGRQIAPSFLNHQVNRNPTKTHKVLTVLRACCWTSYNILCMLNKPQTCFLYML